MLVGQLLLIVAQGHNVKLIKNYDFPLWPGIRHVVAGSSSLPSSQTPREGHWDFCFCKFLFAAPPPIDDDGKYGIGSLC